MLSKLIAPFLFIGVNVLITWYGFFTGKLPTKGSLFGISFDGVVSSSLATQIRFVWLLILINICYTLAFYYGLKHYSGYLMVATLWITSVPIAAILFNTFYVKEPINWVILLGIILITIGAVLVVVNKEIIG
jgi:drug/metabolite transporter (DMT)-like permease